MAVGAEDTGIRLLLLIAQGKDLFKLGGNKPAGLRWGVLSQICRGSREVALPLRSFIDESRNTGRVDITELISIHGEFLLADAAVALISLFL